jgi:hypothetical protein
LKNQYFGDRRDLFKYDLLLDLIESHGSNRLAFIPMLTPNDGSGEGRLTPADRRSRRPALFDFLKACLDAGKRDIRKLRELMPQFGVDYLPFRDADWFTQGNRTEYFEAVPSEYLRESVVFFDPDIGLETGTLGYMLRQGPEKYLLYPELLTVWSRMPDESVLVVYQHLQNNAQKREGDVLRRINDLTCRLGTVTWAVRWNDLAFLVAVRQATKASQIRTTLCAHAHRHGIAFCDIAA